MCQAVGRPGLTIHLLPNKRKQRHLKAELSPGKSKASMFFVSPKSTNILHYYLPVAGDALGGETDETNGIEIIR